jgi:alginate O-acetyltransferase complex protein AlgI
VLFNSIEFLYFFFPAVLALFAVVRRFSPDLAPIVLVGCSLLFYGSGEPRFIFLICSSILVNYSLGAWLQTGSRSNRIRRLILTLGVGGNLALLAYFKYADFLIENTYSLLGWTPTSLGVALPLAISFFTFQQISYIVDAEQRRCGGEGLLNYTFFVSFFPQLIAGPIVRHDEFFAQIREGWLARERGRDLLAGLSMLAIGLFKKVIIADGIAPLAEAVFGIEASSLTGLEAWVGTLAFTFQIYFDFSGYSDIAIGLARCFGIVLPLNFNSPYAADSIIDFWRRWHITLSRFLRDYLYVPLCGNRRGFPRQLGNLMTVMLLGGLWHGAGWNFVIWGGLHGLYLSVNHLWRRSFGRSSPTLLKRTAGRILAFSCVVVAWVFFRAESATHAFEILELMAALPDVASSIVQLGAGVQVLPHLEGATSWSSSWGPVGVLGLLVAAVWYLPPSHVWLERFDVVLGQSSAGFRWSFRGRPSEAAIVGLVLGAAALAMSSTSEFIYFRF